MQQKHVGPCKAIVKRFYFDGEAKACKEFIFGGNFNKNRNILTKKASNLFQLKGCGANKNNFDSMARCEAKCVKKGKEEKQPQPEGKLFLLESGTLIE